jgi:hypothetical protein
MRTKLDDWKNGWFGVDLAIAKEEIEPLIELLKMLKDDPDQHFHLSSDYKGSGGVGSITVYLQSPAEVGNMESVGKALAPGDEIEDRNA